MHLRIDVIHSLETRHCSGQAKKDGSLCNYIGRKSMSAALERRMFVSIQSEPCDNTERLALSEKSCNRLRCDNPDGCTAGKYVFLE